MGPLLQLTQHLSGMGRSGRAACMEGATCREGTTLGKDVYVKAGSGRPRARGYPRARGASISILFIQFCILLPSTERAAENQSNAFHGAQH